MVEVMCGGGVTGNTAKNTFYFLDDIFYRAFFKFTNLKITKSSFFLRLIIQPTFLCRYTTCISR